MHHTQRVQSLDFMRGFAVIVMVMGHSIDAVLNPAARATEWFRLYDAVRGFTAPMFLFVSGFAFAVVAMRRWNEYVVFGSAARKRLGKMLMLLALGYVLHFPFFSLNKILTNLQPSEFAMMVQVDILHCLTVSIVLLQVLVVITRTPGRFAVVTGSLATAIILVSPLVWQQSMVPWVGPVLAPFFNQSVPSLFPVFPFTGYLFTGTMIGTLYTLARRRGEEFLFLRSILRVGIVFGILGLVLDAVPVTVYPPHDFWKTSPNWFLIRIGIIASLTAGFFHIRNLPPVLARNLVTLGQASLVVYAVHLLLVYGSAANPGLMQIIGQQLDAPLALVVAFGVLLLMITLVHARNTMKEHHYYPLKLFQAGSLSTLLYFFLTKPW
jgi:acyltransferase